MKQEIVSGAKPVVIAGGAALVSYLTDIKDMASAITVIIAMLVAIVQLVYVSTKAYRYIFHKERRAVERRKK